RSSSGTWTRSCASAPANSTRTRSEARASGAVHLDPVAPVVLGAVERGVRALHQFLQALAAAQAGHADAHRAREAFGEVAAVHCLDRRAQALGDDPGLGQPGVGQQHQELLAAGAAEQVEVAQVAAEGRGDALEYLVADQVAVAV